MDNIYSALHYAAKAKKSEEKAAEYLQQVGNKVTAVEGIIGDIGIAPFGIDESQNKRRYLNGQVISQSQFESFTKKIKEAIALYPSLSATEENWQAEVTNSVLGQCGKFVIDDELGTIRLPKVVNINGLQDLALMGSIKAESLPNITGYIQDQNQYAGPTTAAGAFARESLSSSSWIGTNNQSGNYTRYTFDASRSSSTYQDNAPVQQEAIQYPYFIQVATGVEESVDVTREIELNNPFSLLDYKWSEYELNNASWLISNGAFHSGTVYKAVYELLLKIKNGAVTKDGVSVKLHEQQLYGYAVSSTESRYLFETENVQVGQVAYSINLEVIGEVTSVSSDSITVINYSSGASPTLKRNTELDRVGSIYTDYDFVLNTDDTTFRLPVKVANTPMGSTAPVVGNGMTLGLTDGTNNVGLCSNNNNENHYIFQTSCFNKAVGKGSKSGSVGEKYGFGVVTDPTKSGVVADLSLSTNDKLKLYFYVGETIQDANVINASGVLTEVANLKGYAAGTPDYSAGIVAETTLGTVKTYTCPAKGIIAFNLSAFNIGQAYIKINNVTLFQVEGASNPDFNSIIGTTEVSEGDLVEYYSHYNNTKYNAQTITFYPYKGVN